MPNPSALESIFFAALQKSAAAERAAFLDAACAGDSEQRAQLDRMLLAVTNAGSFLDRPAIADAVTWQPESSAIARPGTIIGPYKLLQQLGEGGMGIVFMAEQSQPIQRTVALKIIKPAMDSRLIVARFEAERQALAMMDHPNVAKVLDAGTTENGLPYFVMELVKGVPITKYCDEHQLPLRERLDLFLQVCEAVQHAHQKGIIHRDIKPTNVLIAEYDQRPVPKVIDFGVAKATAHKLTERTLFTEFGQVVGTIEYMSPEQAKLNQLDVDTRSDIYSLGVLFYELLTGSTPFGRKRLQESAFDEMLRIIREEEPPKPSTRLSTADALPTIAANRSVESVGLAKLVRGELDWIVMKSLEKDRNRRYETANGFAMDVKRYLAGEPVLAAPPSAAYRLRKFARKHRVSLTATAATLLLLAGVAMFSTWQAVRAHRAEAMAMQSKADETQARTRAELTAAFVITALKSSDARSDGGRQDVTIWAAMGNAIKDIDSGRFDDDPETEATLQDTIATILTNNGRYSEALPLYTQALETRRRILPGDNVYVADSLNHLAVVLLVLCRYDSAEVVAAQALDMNRRLHKGDNKDVGDSLNYLARARQAMGRLPEAEELFAQSLEMWQRLRPGDNLDVAVCLKDLAEVRGLQGRLAEAEPLYLRALEMNQRLHQGDHPSTASAMLRVAVLRQAQGRNVEAEQLLIQALEMQQRIFKSDNPDIVDTLRFLAQSRRELGRLQEAEALSVQALDMAQRVYRSDHIAVAACLRDVGTIRMTLARPAEALPHFVQALEMYQRLFKGDHPQTAECLNDIANARLTLGKPAEAEPLFIQVLEMNRRLFKGDHVSIASNLSNLARTRQSLGKTTEGRQNFDEAIAMLRRISPQGSPLFARVLWRSGTARLDNKDASAALPELEQAVAIAEKNLPPEHPDTKLYRETLAKCKAAR